MTNGRNNRVEVTRHCPKYGKAAKRQMKKLRMIVISYFIVITCKPILYRYRLRNQAQLDKKQQILTEKHEDS